VDGKDVLIDQNFNVPIFNVLWRIATNNRYSHDDPFIGNQVKELSQFFLNSPKVSYLPFMRYLAPAVVGYNQLKKFHQDLKAMFRDIISKHEKEYDHESPPKDFIDAYIKEMKLNPAIIDRDDLIGICSDFFEAGGETVGSTLSWLFLFMALHQDAQEKCYLELREKLGDRIPKLEDKTTVPFCEATVMEVQRLSCVAPGPIPHIANEDGELAGYRIPKGTLLAYNIHKFHTDPDYWGDPESFRPERFLDGGKREQFVPFGMGKRICMGESLARNELFIFSTLILQNFKIGLAVGHERPDPEKWVSGITRVPLPFHVNISLRQ